MCPMYSYGCPIHRRSCYLTSVCLCQTVLRWPQPDFVIFYSRIVYSKRASIQVCRYSSLKRGHWVYGPSVVFLINGIYRFQLWLIHDVFLFVTFDTMYKISGTSMLWKILSVKIKINRPIDKNCIYYFLTRKETAICIKVTLITNKRIFFF